MSNNVILIGPMGAGKTTLGKKLARHLNRLFIDVDETIEARLGVNIQTIFDTEGESGFRQREYDILAEILRDNHHAIIATGGGCILTEACRQLIVGERLVVHVDVGLNQQCERLRYDRKRPILQGGNLREKLKRLRTERHDIYRSMADLHVMTDRNSFRKMLMLIENKMESNG